MPSLRLKFDSYDVSAQIDEAASSSATLVFAHGAGAGMNHSTLDAISSGCTARGISTLRFNFPYMEARKNRTDAQPIAALTIKNALELAQAKLPGPYYLGGHSFGGRMASHAVVDFDLDVAGIVFCSFPLHNPKKPNTDRAAHMDAISIPTLFLSGTRDGMANRELLEGVVARINGTVHWLETADHGYKVLKRTRQHPDDVFTEMADAIGEFVKQTSN